MIDNTVIREQSGKDIISIADNFTWTITNGTEASQRFKISAEAFADGTSLATNSRTYEIQIAHTPSSDWVVTKQPTCSEAGQKEMHCSICNKVILTESIPKINHNLEWQLTPATCTSPLFNKLICVNCGYVDQVLRGFGFAPHTPGAWLVTVPATATDEGTETQKCTVCDAVLGTRSIPPTGSTHTHTEGAPVIIKPATCGDSGTEAYYCTDCGAMLKTQVIPATGLHTFGSAAHMPGSEGPNSCHTSTCTVCGAESDDSCDFNNIITPSTCITDGYTTHTCKECGYAYTDATVPATGHTPGEWAVTTEAACTQDGQKELRCSICKELIESETIPSTGHTPGEWAVTTDATCTQDGQKELRCTVCKELIDTETIPATGHTLGEWAVTTEAACTQDGQKELRCTVCKELIDTEAIPATGHTPGEWAVVNEATNKKKGLEEKRCTVCGAVLQTREIPIKSEWWPNNTACALGTRVRDVLPDLTDKWYMLTEIDLTQNGIQEFPLIASNAYVIGKAYAQVQDGAVTVTYELTARKASVKEEFLTFFSGLDQVKTVEPEELTTQSVLLGEPVNAVELAPGADSVFMLLWLRLDYDIYADGVTRYYEGQYR